LLDALPIEAAGLLGGQRFRRNRLHDDRVDLIAGQNAALYITKLPKAEHDTEEWQAAMQALLLVAEHDGPTMFARIGVMRALNRHVERVFDTSRKEKYRGLSQAET
jgi:hypothetical protein